MPQDAQPSTRRGRPALPDTERRRKAIAIRLTPEEFDRLDAVARKADVTVSAIFRRLILNDLSANGGPSR